jgi:hypothetical protein
LPANKSNLSQATTLTGVKVIVVVGDRVTEAAFIKLGSEMFKIEVTELKEGTSLPTVSGPKPAVDVVKRVTCTAHARQYPNDAGSAELSTRKGEMSRFEYAFVP